MPKWASCIYVHKTCMLAILTHFINFVSVLSWVCDKCHDIVQNTANKKLHQKQQDMAKVMNIRTLLNAVKKGSHQHEVNM